MKTNKALRVNGLLLGLLGASFLALAFNIWDEPPPEDRDLFLSYHAVPAEKNGFYWGVQANQKISKTQAKALSKLETWMRDHSTLWDHNLSPAFLQENLAQNQEALTLFNQEIHAPYNQLPYEYFPDTLQHTQAMPHYSHHTSLAQLKILKSIAFKRAGQEHEALQELVDLLKFSSDLEHYNSLLPLAIGLVIKQSSLEELKLLLLQNQLSTASLHSLIPLLEKYRPSRDALANTFRAEYMSISLYRPKLFAFVGARNWWENFAFLPYFYLPNHCRRMDRDYFRILIRNIYLPPFAQKPLPFPEDWGREGIKIFGPNMVGKILRSLALPRSSPNNALDYLNAQDAFVSLLQLDAAIQGFKREHGKLPRALSDLIPRYLKAIPIDPYDLKPLKYDPQHHRLYSAGKDYLPNTPRNKTKAQPRAENLVLRIE